MFIGRRRANADAAMMVVDITLLLLFRLLLQEDGGADGDDGDDNIIWIIAAPGANDELPLQPFRVAIDASLQPSRRYIP
jgi:hypothetical protein